jgi:hypothetical protein
LILARPTHDEIIRDLTRELAVLKERMERTHRVADDLQNLTVRVALLEQQFADLCKGWEIWAQRLWLILAPFVGAAVGALLTYWLNRK